MGDQQGGGISVLNFEVHYIIMLRLNLNISNLPCCLKPIESNNIFGVPICKISFSAL